MDFSVNDPVLEKQGIQAWVHEGFYRLLFFSFYRKKGHEIKTRERWMLTKEFVVLTFSSSS